MRRGTYIPNPDQGLINAGYVTAVLIPFVGFIIGVVLLTRNHVRQALVCMIVALVAFVFFAALVSYMTGPSDAERMQQNIDHIIESGQ